MPCAVTVNFRSHLLTPWCRVLLEKPTGLQLVKKFLAFHGTRRFITALTSVRHLSLSWASPIQSIYPHPTSCGSILILSTHLRLGLPTGSFPPVSPPRPYTPPLLTHTRHMPSPSQSSSDHHYMNILCIGGTSKKCSFKQDSQCTHNVTLRRVRATIVALSEQ